MMKRKVWIVSWYGIQAGGLERVVQIINRVLESDYDVEIIDISYISRSIGCHSLLKIKNRLALMVIFSIYATLRDKKYDIIITHGQNAPFIRSDFLFDHGSIMSLKREIGECVYGGSSIFEWIAVKNAKLNIAVSKWTKEQIINNYHVKEDRVIVLNNCVETSMFYPVPHNNNEKVTILFCGRLEKAKGIDILLQIADLVETSEIFKLAIAANTSDNAFLFLNRKNINIKCGTPVDLMNDFYNSGDVLFVPSQCEGFGMGIVESLAAGIPVVTNKVGIVSELIEGGCPGIELVEMGETAEGVLLKMYDVAKRNQEFDRRLAMHSFVEKYYGGEQYRNKLLKIIGACYA